MKLSSVLLCLGVVGCSESEPEPFILQINSQDVVAAAVHGITVEIESREPDRRFEETTSADYAKGQLEARVTSAGEWILDIGAEWFNEHRRELMTGGAFALDVPLRSEPGSAEGLDSFEVTATFHRNDEDIAAGIVLVEWPLISGERTVVTVMCTREPPDNDFGRQCTNNDP